MKTPIEWAQHIARGGNLRSDGRRNVSSLLVAYQGLLDSVADYLGGDEEFLRMIESRAKENLDRYLTQDAPLPAPPKDGE